MDLYRELILDHYRSTRHRGRVDAPDAAAEGENPLCGDEVSVTLRIEEGRVTQARFEGRGCAISQAAASMLMEMVEGREAKELASLGREELLAQMGVELSPVRLKCALLPLAALRVAVGGQASEGGDKSASGIEARPTSETV